MSEKDARTHQHDEVEAIRAMYPGDIEVAESGNPQFTIHLYPQRGSSGGAGVSLENITFLKLHVMMPPKYPQVIPVLSIKEGKGLSAQEIQDLDTQLKKLSQQNIGEPMVYQLLNFAEEFLFAHQKKPTGSFHDEMLMRDKLIQERNAQMQMLFKERERLAIREEILKKQDELRKEEQRRRKEFWKSTNDVSPNGSLEGSPAKGDCFPGSLKQAMVGRRKRRSISSRRRRSNSEGSDSSLSEGTDLVMLEFVSGKTVQQFYKGEIIGRSQRGNTVYAGISNSGSLVAIYEWKFTIAVDRKGKPNGIGGDLYTVEGLIKQLQSFEIESNLMQKLEHSNTVLYHGMKILQPTDEAGVVYLYMTEEFLRGHTVKSYLQDPQQLCSMALPLLRHITNGVLEALKFLHDNDIAHRFLRDTSIFLDVGDEVKICDYGIERKASELYQLVHQNPDVSEHYPPSVGRGGKKGDIYRLGLIVLSLLKGRYIEGPDIPQTLPPEIQDFLKHCLSTLENNRWTAAELLDHPFLKMSINKGPNIHGLNEQAQHKDEGSNEEDADPAIPPRIASTIPFSAHSRLHNEFQVLEWLGKGGFGDVLKVKNKLDSRIYALKRIKLNPRNRQLNKKITREVKLLSQLNHENVVRYFNSWIETVEEDETEESNTESMSTENTSPRKFNKEPSVRFQLDKIPELNQNSLGFMDNIEDLAPPMKDSEWSISYANDVGNDGDDSEDSSDEVDLFGTSFLRLTTDDSDAVIFETDSRTGASETDDTAEESSRSKRFPIEPNHVPSKNDSASPTNLPLHREAQYMYIQMEFCEKSTLRTAIDDNLYEDLDRTWRLFREIVEGLVHIHQQGMIHRDLKPVNIFLDSHDHVKIGDFGLATSSILPKFTTGESFHEKHEEPHSVDFPEESQTGQVGTALYVAPELITKGIKITYNQKVDIYSLGIIFFEMFYHPLPTSMERVRVLSALRLPAISFPRDFDELLMPQVSHITRWLLSHDPCRRPTSLELLQSDYLPPPHLEEAELRDIFSRTLKNSQSKAYKFLIASCFLQNVTPVENFTFDMENTRIPIIGMKCFHFFHKLKLTVQKVFERHGGLEVGSPILMPKTPLYEENESCVNLMCHSGNIVSLPHDLRIPFARYIGRYGITHMKRYAIEKVFRERKVYGLHPRELVECAFDIIDCTPGSLIADAEILSIAVEVTQELPWFRNKTCTLRLGHTKLLDGLLLHHGVDAKFHSPIKKILSEIKVESASSKSQIQTYLCNRGLPEHFISMLFALMEVEGSLPKVSNLLKSITKRKGEAASLVKAGLHELEILMNHVDNLGFKCGVAIVPTMVFGSHIYSGLLFQLVCNLRKRKNKMTVDVIAAGGRYDALIESFRSALGLESELIAAASKEHYSQSHSAVGISISFDKLVAGYDGEDCSEWQRRGTVDAVICSVGHHPLSKEKLELMKELWAHGIKCSVLECSQTLESAEEQCREMGAQFMLILKENEFYSNLRVRIWERVMFQERKMSRQEAVELISRRVNGCATNEAYSSSTNVGTSRSESLSTKVSSSTGTESNVSSVVANNSTMPLLNISFVVQEREKLANWKKRYENQVMHHITDVLPKLAKQQQIEVLGMDVNSSVVNTLAACLVSSDKDEFHKGVSDAIEKHTRLRKYLQNICDEIYELWFEKSASVIILYGLIDNSYRVLF
ncbi:unnamed protein product [Orchesella dallaii]|uniref:non-specific serine/threonine protein kinase n=1 Tax=Orchesella dallaii TaxID=48710 RepID=A0ABP1RXV8_9HEXA